MKFLQETKPAPSLSHPKELSAPPQNNLQTVQNGGIRRLGLEVRIKQQRRAARPPAIRVAEAPNGDADAVGDVQASLGGGDVVGGGGADDVELGDGALVGGGAQGLHGGAGAGGLAGLQVRLRADAVDGDAGGAPGLDLGDQAGGFGVGGRVEAVWGRGVVVVSHGAHSRCGRKRDVREEGWTYL